MNDNEKLNFEAEEKLRFKDLLSDKFNGNLKSVNDALDKYIESKDYRKEFNKKAYIKHKENDEFKQKKKEYDKTYYQEHKDKLLKDRKDRYNNDNEFKEQMKLKQKNIILNQRI